MSTPGDLIMEHTAVFITYILLSKLIQREHLQQGWTQSVSCNNISGMISLSFWGQVIPPTLLIDKLMPGV